MSIASKIVTRLGLRSSGLPMTPEEFDGLPSSRMDRRYRYELIGGVLIVTPRPANGEVDPNEYLGYLLIGHHEHHAQGSVIDRSLPEQTILTRKERRRCDRAIWLNLGRIPDPEKDIPTIVVEFVSWARRDYIRDYERKFDEYMAIGVREYWIIDRFRRTMTVHKNILGTISTIVVAEASTYQTDLIPGFVLPLARLLARGDNWPRKSRRKPKTGDPR